MSLSVNPWLMLVVFTIFILSVYLLNKWLYKPLLTFIDNRNISIKSDLESIQNNGSEIAFLDAEAARVLTQARSEANLIREKAIQSAMAISEKKITTKHEELEKKKKEFLKVLAEEEGVLRSSLLAQMPLYRESLKAKISQL
ncbi:MAG: FoF1 ATP synthase subunit B' [Wolinella sp.]